MHLLVLMAAGSGLLASVARERPRLIQNRLSYVLDLTVDQLMTVISTNSRSSAQPEAETTPELASFGSGLNVVVVGASGGIGGALADELDACSVVSTIVRLSRSPLAIHGDSAWLHIDLEDEHAIASAASNLTRIADMWHLVIVATGTLHKPEKTWRELSMPAMETAFRINAIGPAMVAKHFLPLLATKRKSVFAALSARVGSIADNQLGGWHAYRSSKAALNMLIKTLSIELSRRNPEALCVGLHPGTVDTALSKPFLSGVPAGQLFSPKQSARKLLAVLDQLTAADAGYLYAWDGSRIPF
jgi:NAD(P)-dependent dehydrogenase (short-subunit alcohol dehydrogenase family)